MRVIKSILAIIAIAILTGCAASGPKYTEVKSTIPTLASDKGRIYFYREDSMLGAAIRPDIKIGSEVVGSSVPGGFFFVDRPAGTYEISTTTEVENKINITLAAGDTKYVRTSISMGVMVGRVKPELVYPEQARAELGNMSYIGTDLIAKK